MRKEYIRKGKCIFCGKASPEVTFFEKPHTTPHSLGSDRIGFDICDSCNHFFGEPDKSMYSGDQHKGDIRRNQVYA